MKRVILFACLAGAIAIAGVPQIAGAAPPPPPGFGPGYGPPPPPPHPPRYPPQNPGGMAVSVQQQLARLGYYYGAVDGIVGRGTRAAIRHYQSDYGLPITGRIDPPLLESLRR